MKTPLQRFHRRKGLKTDSRSFVSLSLSPPMAHPKSTLKSTMTYTMNSTPEPQRDLKNFDVSSSKVLNYNSPTHCSSSENISRAVGSPLLETLARKSEASRPENLLRQRKSSRNSELNTR